MKALREGHPSSRFENMAQSRRRYPLPTALAISGCHASIRRRANAAPATPVMTTINDLVAALANALGLPRRLVDATARHRREARMLAEGDAPATVEHAVAEGREPASNLVRL